MRALIHDHPIAWTPPAPFWADADHNTMQTPSILRFTTDDFMEELQRLLASDPEKLTRHMVVPETWRGIRTPARMPNPAGGRNGLFTRLGVTARRQVTPATPKPEALSTARLSDGRAMPLKLYQPAHQRFYLVGATLICQRPGLPDRRIDAGKAEKVSFVVRRWFPPNATIDRPLPPFDSTWTEHAYVAQSNGTFAWVPVPPRLNGVDPGQRLIAGEDQLPLFPLSYGEDDRRTRRLLAGLIPVGKREAYHAVSKLDASGNRNGGGSTEHTPLLVLFRRTVSEPWKAMVDVAAKVRALQVPPAPQPVPTATEFAPKLNEARTTIQHGSWLVLLELLSFLKIYVRSVHDALGNASATLGGKPGDLLRVLRQTSITGSLPTTVSTPTVPSRNLCATSLDAALARLRDDPAMVQKLESATQPYIRPTLPADDLVAKNPDYPTFLFPLADPSSINNAGKPNFTGLSGSDTLPDDDIEGGPAPAPAPTDFDNFKAAIDRLAALVLRAVVLSPDDPMPSMPAAADRPADLRPGWFTIRCVYERPNCGALHDDVVSASTEKFQLAHFFDPDAPARPIRIGLPIDTTPAGLRKFDKNTAFVMSDVLCGQIARMKALTFGDLVLSVLPWPFHKDLSVPDNGPCKSSGGVSIGLICSLSIPIITICALILLIIIVMLLDLIFRWIPWFVICFPLPGLRAKEQS